MGMKRLFLIQHPTFDSQTLVAVGKSDKDIIAWVEKHTNVETDEDFAAVIACPGEGRTVSDGGFTMIRFKVWNGTHADIARLAHEAFHLAEFIFDRIGVKYDLETSGEVFAYFIQHTVKQVLNKLGPDGRTYV